MSGPVGRLRVMTYNIKGLTLDEDALVQVVRSVAPDVLGVQEPPRALRGRRRLRTFARRCGLRVAVGGGGARTTALLVSEHVAVTGAGARRLPWRLGQVRRGFCVARVDGVLVAVLHLALGAHERGRHLDRVLREIDRETGPRVVVGDLNEQPGGEVWGRLTRHLRDAVEPAAPTFSARRPRRRIDAVLISPDLRVVEATVLRDDRTRRASDHLPIVVDLERVDAEPLEDLESGAQAEHGTA
ncbi:endonuclease/exonuclease/phosphatase family protein [Cellulomonas fimi]|uniref:Endonuclease n=1 Tax=Cellulomonas fimi TaxID=1708 RepID=A0A7Y0QI20_CELFI|nr:endonuclease/exonuclease/phosphatase family protein [Cellulomonas fimi]NMR19787.1 endonuclease [Cellulomonas fimi]